MAKFNVAQRPEGITIKSKFLATFGVISVIIMTMSAIGVWTVRQSATSSQAMYAGNTLPLAEFAEMGTALTTHHQILTGIAGVTSHADYVVNVARLSPYQGKVKSIIASYAATAPQVSRSGRDGKKDLAILKSAIDKYFKDAEGALSVMADSFGKSLSAEQAEHMRDLGKLALTVNIQPTFDLMVARHHEQVLDMREVAKDLNEHAQALADDGTRMLIVVGIFAALVCLALGYWAAHKVALGIGQVANAVKSAADGHYQARAKVTSNDEIGQMAASFNAMMDRMTALVTSESERDDMQKRLMSFLVLVSDIGKGDLTKRGEVTADMFGNLADGFNLMISRFGQLLKQVREAAERVNKSSGVLRDNTRQMSGTAKHQADESKKTLEAVENLARSMRQVAETAGASSDSAKLVLEATARGREAVQKTVEDMQSIRTAVQRMSKQVKALGDRSVEISQIVSAIREIANRTNLLALNAAIEAAGAGEAGARFAVVAEQVRKLAESSSQATREIADLVKVIQSETQEAVVEMENETKAVEVGSKSAMLTGDVFEEISGIAKRSAELAETIAASAANQTVSADQVRCSIKEFTGGTVETQKATDAARLTVEDMTKLADSLTASVAQFKLV
ncbi:MAG TPA: methyl-accepting chemotaxis protein [Nitrospiraceae bacterium]|nr:methyl-accepting chemotaxis protein [Nitrospiraceae bacterium]